MHGPCRLSNAKVKPHAFIRPKEHLTSLLLSQVVKLDVELRWMSVIECIRVHFTQIKCLELVKGSACFSRSAVIFHNPRCHSKDEPAVFYFSST